MAKMAKNLPGVMMAKEMPSWTPIGAIAGKKKKKSPTAVAAATVKRPGEPRKTVLSQGTDITGL